MYTGTEAEAAGASAAGSKSDSNKYDMTISSWKILNVNENGTIELIPARVSGPDIPLYGAQGYNNGVNLLNEACSALYGDVSKGISARSIRIEDVEALINETDLANAKRNVGKQASAALGTGHNLYPAIYAEEKGAVIGEGSAAEEGLGQSEQREGLISRSAGIVEENRTINPLSTYWDAGDFETALLPGRRSRQDGYLLFYPYMDSDESYQLSFK